MINALILAAGESRRMGMPKPLLRFGAPSGSCVPARPGASGDARPAAEPTSQGAEIRPSQDAQMGGSVKAEGLGDGEWADHRQSFDELRRVAALDDATRNSMIREAAARPGDTTFLERVIDVLQASAVDRTMVVLGARAELIRTSIDLSSVDVVVNEDYHQGQLSSLVKGLQSLPEGTEAMLLCLVDHPLITTEAVNRLIAAFKESRRPIVLPVFDGRRGHPTLFARSLFDELTNAPQDKGARHVVALNEDKVLEVNVTDRGVLMSIDTPEDYRSCFGTEPQVVSKKS